MTLAQIKKHLGKSVEVFGPWYPFTCHNLGPISRDGKKLRVGWHWVKISNVRGIKKILYGRYGIYIKKDD